MSETINWSVNVQVPAGPRLAKSGTVEIDAYDKLDIAVADGETDKEIELQPGGLGQVQVLLLLTNDASEDLTYKVNAAGADPIPLDQPVHVYLGAGPIALLDAAAGPTSLFFSNASGADAAVQVFVGRKATP